MTSRSDAAPSSPGSDLAKDSGRAPARNGRTPGPRGAAVGACVVLLLGACASAGGGGAAGPAEEGPAGAAPRAEAPAPPGFQGIPPEVRPGEDALQASDTMELTGIELGTMWTFENPPLDYWEDRYGFRPDPAWLEHVRLASLRYGEICSASFVSPRGLVMTNHHCARDCVEAISTGERDYVETGFYAASREEERLCPDLHLDQLVGIEEVTSAVRSAAPEGTPPREAAGAREAVRDSIAESCEEETGLRCEVVSLYHGGQYQLYRYRRFAPVKLVFAPELQAGFYGGDPDNFTYPRFNLDVAFVRAYRSDSASVVEPEHWFEWDPEGAEEGELTFVTGNPGSTSRMYTVAQLVYERKYRHPFVLQLLEEQRDYLQRIAEMGPEAARQVRDRLFSLENSLKAYRGQLRGLRDPALMGQKIRWQRDLQERVRSRPELQDRFGHVWGELAGLQVRKLDVSPRLNVNNAEFLGSPYVVAAHQLVQVLRYRSAPDSARPEELTDERLEELTGRLRSELPLNRTQEGGLLAIRLRIADRWLAGDAPFRRAAFRAGESPEEAAARLVRGTRLDDTSVRRRLLEAGPAVLDTVSDPLLRLVAGMEARFRELDTRWDEITAEESAAEERLADALFAVFGTDIPPDATFTLRITDGEMRRYPYNGTFAPPKTSIHGLYGRAAEFDGESPWELPAGFREARERVEMSAALNFVTTNDITGGNSGSPMIDREGRIVGIAFDGNIEQLPNEFLFRTEAARTVGVHTEGTTEALRRVYEAERLLDELLSGGEADTAEAAAAAGMKGAGPATGVGETPAWDAPGATGSDTASSSEQDAAGTGPDSAGESARKSAGATSARSWGRSPPPGGSTGGRARRWPCNRCSWGR